MRLSMLRGLLKSLLILGLLCAASAAFAQGQVAGPPNAILCNQLGTFGPTTANSVFNITSPSTSQGLQRVYICGWHVTTQASVSTESFQLLMGSISSGALNCAGGTGAQTVTPSLAVSSTAPSTDHIDFAMAQTGQGQQLCVNTIGTSMSGIIYFTMF